MSGIGCLGVLLLWIALASGQTAPALEWENDGFTWQLYTKPATWRAAEDWCVGVGDGWHMASLTTPQQFDYTSQQLLNASRNRTFFGTSDLFLEGCEFGKLGVTVWVGLYDPTSAKAQGDTWKAVASKFVWSDGQKRSLYLANDAHTYFSRNASEEQYCIVFNFCSLGAYGGGYPPPVTLTKLPCHGQLPFLCKGPSRKAPAGPTHANETNGSQNATAPGALPPAAAPATGSNSSATPTGCQPRTLCAAVVGPVVSAVGAIIVAFLGYLGVKKANRPAPKESGGIVPPPRGGSSMSKSAPHIINVNPVIQVHGNGGVSTVNAPSETRPPSDQQAT